MGRHFAVLPADDDHSVRSPTLAADASCLLCIYQPLNKCFTIESTINKMREDDLNAALAKDNEPLPEDPTEKAEESTEASSDDSSSDVQ